jgi:citrate synthase
MFRNLRENIANIEDDAEVEVYLKKIMDKKAFDGAGLIYGMGHAVYSVSDPRAKMLKMFVEDLANEKGLNDELKLYKTVERLAPEIIARERKIYKGVCINVDFYSGFIYDMLNIPHELYTPMFAMARIAGWSAHRLEEIINGGKIIRPAYKAVSKHKDYSSLESRDYDD